MEFIEISNNEKNIINYLKFYSLYFNNFNPHLIIWKNKHNYWIDVKLIPYINSNKSINFMINLSSTFFRTEELTKCIMTFLLLIFLFILFINISIISGGIRSIPLNQFKSCSSFKIIVLTFF